MSSGISIKSADTSDIPGIAGVLVDTWRSTFRGVLSDAFLDGMSTEHQISRYLKILTRPKVCCLVAADSASRVVGFCCGGPNRSAGLSASAEIYAIYVRHDQHGKGVGGNLLNTVAQQLLSTVGPGLVVWVIASNPFRPFYERMGGREISHGNVTLGGERVQQIAYIWGRLPNSHSS